MERPDLIQIVDVPLGNNLGGFGSHLEKYAGQHDELERRPLTDLEADKELAVPELNARRVLDVEDTVEVRWHPHTPTVSTEPAQRAPAFLNERLHSGNPPASMTPAPGL